VLKCSYLVSDWFLDDVGVYRQWAQRCIDQQVSIICSIGCHSDKTLYEKNDFGIDTQEEIDAHTHTHAAQNKNNVSLSL